MSISFPFSGSTFKRLMVGIFLEFSPILIFLASFERFHIYRATTYLMIATIISTIVTYRVQKRLPYVALYMALITIAFGYLTLMHREPKFIQMRDTLYDLTCAMTLLLGLMINVSFLKIAFHEVVPMTTRAWHRLTYAWIGFFILVALMNEYIRRTASLQDWFDFKGIMVIVTVIFGFLALGIFYEKEKGSQ